MESHGSFVFLCFRRRGAFLLIGVLKASTNNFNTQDSLALQFAFQPLSVLAAESCANLEKVAELGISMKMLLQSANADIVNRESAEKPSNISDSSEYHRISFLSAAMTICCHLNSTQDVFHLSELLRHSVHTHANMTASIR